MGILSKPPADDEYATQLKGILGNLGANSGWQALTNFGANLMKAPNWSQGIGGGLEAANQTMSQNTGQRMSLLEALANEHARQQQLALSADSIEHNPDYQRLQLQNAQQNFDMDGAKPVAMGTDPNTLQPIMGTYNKATKRYEPVQTPGAGTSGLPATTNDKGEPLSVDDYVKTIKDPLQQGLVGSVLRGETSLDAIGTRNGQNQAMVTRRLVSNFDPMFNNTDAVKRVSLVKSLADPKGLGAIKNSVGKMATHFNALVDDAKDLNQSPNIIWNKITQNFETSMEGDPHVTNFMADLNNYGHEYAKVLKSGGGNGGAAPTDQDMQEIAALMSAARSPEQIRGVLQRWDHASRGQTDSIDSSNQQTMDKYWNPEKHSILNPVARREFAKADSNPWLHPEAARSAAPAGPTGAPQASKLPPGNYTYDPATHSLRPAQ